MDEETRRNDLGEEGGINPGQGEGWRGGGMEGWRAVFASAYYTVYVSYCTCSIHHSVDGHDETSWQTPVHFATTLPRNLPRRMSHSPTNGAGVRSSE